MADPLDIMNQIAASMGQLQSAAPNKRKEMLEMMTKGEQGGSGMQLPKKSAAPALPKTSPVSPTTDLQSPFTSSLAGGRTMVA